MTNFSSVTFKTHVAFESWETIFTLFTFRALETSDTVCSLHSSGAGIANRPLWARRTQSTLVSRLAFLPRVTRRPVSTREAREPGFALRSFFPGGADGALRARETLRPGVPLLTRRPGLPLGTHVAFGSLGAVDTRDARLPHRSWRAPRPQQAPRASFPWETPRSDFSVFPPHSVFARRAGRALGTAFTPVTFVTWQTWKSIKSSIPL